MTAQELFCKIIDDFRILSGAPEFPPAHITAVFNKIMGHGWTSKKLRECLDIVAGQKLMYGSDIYGALMSAEKIRRIDMTKNDFVNFDKCEPYNRENADYGKRILNMVAKLVEQKKSQIYIEAEIDKFHKQYGDGSNWRE